MVLLNIIETTGVQAGAIRLSDGENYAFTAPQNTTGFAKNISLDCRFDKEFKLYSITGQGRALPCMFNMELLYPGNFFCPNTSSWHEKNTVHFPKQRPCCERCKKLGYETIVIAPIKTAGELLGLIHLYDSREKAITPNEVIFLERISGPLGYTLKRLQDKEATVRSEQALKSSYEHLKAFSSMILRVQEEERMRLSRELHDEVGQALTAVKIDLQTVKEKIGKTHSCFGNRLSESIRLVDATLERVRKQAVSLRPPALDHMGLVVAVQNMAQKFSCRTDIETKVITENKMIRFSGEIETALFRCIQESLTNVARHSGAKKVIIELKYLSGSLHVSIEDDGKGFENDLSSRSSPHLGLIGMQERVRLLNGDFKIDSKPGTGTRITIKIPLRN